MKASIIQIGNSQGVRIPKAILQQLNFSQSVEFEILPEGLLLRPVDEETAAIPRAGWAEMFIAAASVFDSLENRQTNEFVDWNADSLNSFDKNEW